MFVFQGMTNQEVLSQVERGFRMPKPANCTEALYEVMRTCWHEGPEKRPTFEHLWHTLEDFPTATEHQYEEQNQV